jgi:hypothetical protein
VQLNRCIVMQFGAVCYSVLQCVAVSGPRGAPWCISPCGSVFQCSAYDVCMCVCVCVCVYVCVCMCLYLYKYVPMSMSVFLIVSGCLCGCLCVYFV